jgi:excisionase family DNA binding protein
MINCIFDFINTNDKFDSLAFHRVSIVIEKQPDQTFVTTREAADLLGVSVRTVQLWVENGVLHAWKTAGGHRRIARASVDTLLAQQQAVIETVSGLRTLQVVLIDDNPTQLKLYKLQIESLHLPLLLTTAGDGFQGLLAVGRCDPDVVIVSLDIGGVDALELVSSIRKAAPSTYFIALSGSGADSPEKSAVRRLLPDMPVLSPLDDLDSIGPFLSKQLEARRRH